jgi:hypothetical protein
VERSIGFSIFGLALIVLVLDLGLRFRLRFRFRSIPRSPVAADTAEMNPVAGTESSCR